MKKFSFKSVVEKYGTDSQIESFKRMGNLPTNQYNSLLRTVEQWHEHTQIDGRGSKRVFTLSEKLDEPLKREDGRENNIGGWNKIHEDENFYRDDICTVYKITNKITGMIYVGSTKTKLSKRIQNHKHHYNNKNASVYTTRLSQAMRKYGWDNFKFEIIQHWEDTETLLDVEDLWMINLKSYRKDIGYNARFNRITQHKQVNRTKAGRKLKLSDTGYKSVSDIDLANYLLDKGYEICKLDQDESIVKFIFYVESGIFKAIDEYKGLRQHTE